MQTTSIFDATSFMETTHKGGLDTTYVLPDVGDYAAQITDKVELRSGLVGADKQRAGEPWASADIQWEILDDGVKKKLNMERVFVRQSLMLDLVPGSGTNGTPAQLDFGTNRNMRLKRLLEATGLNRQKSWNFNMLKFQQGTIHVEHRKPDGFDDFIADVTRVAAVGATK
jgi:hypothetical protein